MVVWSRNIGEQGPGIHCDAIWIRLFELAERPTYEAWKRESRLWKTKTGASGHLVTSGSTGFRFWILRNSFRDFSNLRNIAANEWMRIRILRRVAGMFD